MTKKPSKKVTSEVKEVIEKAKTPSKPSISFDKYIEKHKPHYGLVVSFKYEASKTEQGLADRTEDEWAKAFEAQNTRTY